MSESVSQAQKSDHPWIYLNDSFIPSRQNVFPVTTQAFNYGTGVFEGIRAYINTSGEQLNIFRLDEHLERLLQSAKILHLHGLPNAEELKKITIKLLQKNNPQENCYIRPIAFKQDLLPDAGFGVKLSGIRTGLTIYSLNMHAYAKQDGLRCTITSWRRIADSAIPARAKITGSYVNSALATETAQRNGFDEALMLNSHGNLAESTTSNVFIIKRGRLITPPLSAHILEGITRDTVIILAKRYLNLSVEERDILPSELLSADECFLCGTGMEITPVSQIDHHLTHSMKLNSISLKIRSLYAQVVRGELEEFNHWLTPVPSIEE